MKSIRSWTLTMVVASVATLGADSAAAIDRRVHTEQPTTGPLRSQFPSQVPSVQPTPMRQVTRIIVSDESELGRFRSHYDKREGWRTYGITYGRVGPLKNVAALQFLNDGLLVGSYDDDGHPVYVYAFNDTGSERVIEVGADGRILREWMLS